MALGAVQAPAAAQTPYIFGGGGVSIPTGDYKNAAKTGWAIQGGIGVSIPKSTAWVEAEGWYSSSKSKLNTADKYNLLGGFAAVGYNFGPKENKAHPYVVGGLGFLNNKFSPGTGTSVSSTAFAQTIGAGVSVKMGSQAVFFAEARAITGSKNGGRTTIIPITAGVSIDLAKSK
jgi:hypothetical protein